MGTRSLTIIQDEKGKEIAVIYRQFDGYPNGQGVLLKSILANRKVVNGYTQEDKANRAFNGPGCMAANLVMELKKECTIGGIYLEPAGTRDFFENYRYWIKPCALEEVGSEPSKGRIWLRVEYMNSDSAELLWQGFIDNFDPEAIQDKENKNA